MAGLIGVFLFYFGKPPTFPEPVWKARGAASGLYVYRLEAGAHRAERKMLLVR